MERNRHILQADGVAGMWIGARASKPYIMLAVMENRGNQQRDVIPDSVDGVSVYYVEGTSTGQLTEPPPSWLHGPALGAP